MTGSVVYLSKVDGWFKAVLLLSALSCAVAVLAPGMVGEPRLALALSPLLLVGVGLPLWLLNSTYYVLGERELEARCGPFKWTVPLAEISAAVATRSAHASPALSLDRIRIEYGQGRSILVSPDNQAAFLAELRRRTGQAGGPVTVTG